MHYTKLNNSTNGNPRYLVNLTEEQAKLIKAKKATDKQSITIQSLDGDYIYLNYIITSYNIVEDLNSIKEL
jgi:hypothetical protein